MGRFDSLKHYFYQHETSLNSEKLRFLPTKEEFFTKMDEVMGELKAMREAFDLHTGQLRT